ncbi:MAG: hypothetical protein QOF17_1217, partial [Solirubrobacteraceae bacterium]|nr:hypothetical protein [Solirubrobacteraceae bacterium]
RTAPVADGGYNAAPSLLAVGRYHPPIQFQGIPTSP